VEAHPARRSHVQAGIVSGLWRYPVKSMAGEALASTDISWAGLAADRRWAFAHILNRTGTGILTPPATAPVHMVAIGTVR
jgi:uncharacterized protein YcbX